MLQTKLPGNFLHKRENINISMLGSCRLIHKKRVHNGLNLLRKKT